MEKFGLEDSLAFLKKNKVKVKCIVTDRHPQIKCFLKLEKIPQFYDVWHFEKSKSISRLFLKINSKETLL